MNAKQFCKQHCTVITVIVTILAVFAIHYGYKKLATSGSEEEPSNKAGYDKCIGEGVFCRKRKSLINRFRDILVFDANSQQWSDGRSYSKSPNYNKFIGGSAFRKARK